METNKFKTNIKCEGCIAKVTPALNEVAGVNHWKVDLNDPLRTLTVDRDIPDTILKEAIEKVGYKIERL